MNMAIIPLLLSLLSSSMTPALAADEYQQIETLQRRADKLAFGELGPENYHLAKARTWLDFAFTEYNDKDDSGVISAAIGQAEGLLDALENNQPNITMDTPQQIIGGEAVRPDLWEKINALKKEAKFTCGQRPTAEAEVYMVWSGHEYHESGQSHAASYMRAVEDRIYSAQVAIDNCKESASSPSMEKITLSSDAMFSFNKATLNATALSSLNELAENIKKVNMLEEVVLVGHTDRLRSDGHPERNQLCPNNVPKASNNS